MKLLRILVGVIVLMGIAFGIAWAATEPLGLPEQTESVARLAAGPHDVGLEELLWVDTTRPTMANADFAGAPERSLPVALWYPIDAPGPHPLVVYSHGFMSTRYGGQYLAEHLASYGYVVLATSFPLTTLTAPGGPNVADAVNQPGDVSFMLDSVLALGEGERPFSGSIDVDRIGVFGTSLGGLTSTLVAFHPELRDPRISVAISIAGPTMLFAPSYFSHADVAFLMIGATSDAMVDFVANAANVPDLVPGGSLFVIRGGTHAGFSHTSAGGMRVFGNPDDIGCLFLLENLELMPGTNPFAGLGTAEQGILEVVDGPLPCEQQFDIAMQAGRQQMLATLAVRAFFESQFADDARERKAHAQFLERTAPQELAEVSFARSPRD